MSNPKCDGACEEHYGPVRKVFVKGWGLFDYCDAAVAEDKSRGLTLLEGDDIPASLTTEGADK